MINAILFASKTKAYVRRGRRKLLKIIGYLSSSLYLVCTKQLQALSAQCYDVKTAASTD